MPKVKLLTSTKSVLLEEKINIEISELEEQGYKIDSITSNISYTGERSAMAYMILCQIVYSEDPSRQKQASL